VVFPIPLAVGDDVQFGTVGIFDHDFPCVQARVGANEVVSLVGAVACTSDDSFETNAIFALDELAVLPTFVVPIGPLYDLFHYFRMSGWCWKLEGR
jgi:hypothetical protein